MSITTRSNATGKARKRAPSIDVHAHLHLAEREQFARGLPGWEASVATTSDWIGADTRAHTAMIADELMNDLTNLERRLQAMDDMGIDIQAVSLAPAQYYYWAGREDATKMVAESNRAITDFVAQAPDRFVGVADVALAHPDLAAEQLEYAVTELDMRAVQISSRAHRMELSDPKLEPFWAAAARLQVPVILHPLGCSLGPRLSTLFLNNTVGQPIEHAVALSHIIFSGILDRHPDLILLAEHGGGFLPYYLGRSDHAWTVRPEARGCKELPSSYIARLYFDALIYRPDTLRQLIDLAGADRIMIGTDYPYDMGVRDPLDRLNAVPGLSDATREAIRGGTAAKLFGIK